jgi:hypothetical protein
VTNELDLTAASDQIKFIPNNGPNYITVSMPSTSGNYSYKIVDVRKSSEFLMKDGDKTINGQCTFTQNVTFLAAVTYTSITYSNQVVESTSDLWTGISNQLLIQPNGVGPVFIFNAMSPISNVTIGIPDPQQDTNLCYTSSAQTITDKTIVSPVISGTVTGGATYNSVTLVTPTITGTETLAGQLLLTVASSQIEFKPSNGPSFTIFNVPIPTTGNWTISFQDPTQNTNVAYTDSAQTLNTKTLPSPVISGTVTGGATYNSVTLVTPTITGTETLTGQFLITVASNQIEFKPGNGPSFTIFNVPIPTTGNWTISFQDPTQNTNVAYTDSAQTLNSKTLPSPVISGTVTGGATYNSVTLVSPTVTGTELLTGQLLITVASNQIEFKPSNGPSFTIFNVPIPTTGNWTISFQDPTQNTNVVYTDSAQTLNSKTLATSTTISGTLSVTASTTFVAGHTVSLAGANTVTGGITFSGNVKFSSPTYLFLWNQDGLTNGFVVSMDALAAQRFLNFPDPTVDTNVAYTDGPQTFTSKTLSSPTITNPSITGTVSGPATYSGITLSGTTTSSGTFLMTGSTSPLVAQNGGGSAKKTTIVFTTPVSNIWLTVPDTGGNDTFCFLSATQTLTSKTLTSPTITNPSITGTVSGGASYTAPTITSPSITGTVSGGASYTGPTITSPSVTGTVSGGASYTGPTITSPSVTGTVSGGATYSSPTLSGTVGGSPAFSGTPTFNNGMGMPAGGSSNNVLNYYRYDNGTGLVSLSAFPGGTSSIYVYVVRIGHFVSWSFDTHLVTCTTSNIFCISTTPVPAHYRFTGMAGTGPTSPTNQVFTKTISIWNNGVKGTGLFQTDSLGVMCWYPDAAAATSFTASGTCGFEALSINFWTNN